MGHGVDVVDIARIATLLEKSEDFLHGWFTTRELGHGPARSDADFHQVVTHSFYLGGEKIRKAVDLTSREAASDLIAGCNASGQIAVMRQKVPTIAEAVTNHVADAEARNLKPKSSKKIRDGIERRFLGYCTKRGYLELRQLDVDSVRDFRN